MTYFSRLSNTAAPQWEPRKPLAGHMTKGQRAMAVAKIYPEPEKGGRGKKALKNSEFGVSRQYIGFARTVLHHASAGSSQR